MSQPSINTTIDDIQNQLSRLRDKIEQQASSHFEKFSTPAAPSGDAEPDDKCYPLDGKPGCVLIISNGFKNGPRSRPKASEADLNKMHELWVETIGCEQHDPPKKRIGQKDKNTQCVNQSNSKQVRKHRNQTAEEMKHLLETLAHTHKNYSYIVVIISTHGGLVPESAVKEYEQGKEKDSTSKEKESNKQIPEDVVKESTKPFYEHFNKKNIKTGGDKAKEQRVPVFVGEDWQPLRETEMFEMFYNEENPQLLHKPKFFILDYCRAETEDEAKEEEKTADPIYECIDNITEEPPVMPSAIPIMSDMIKAYATHHSHAALEYKNGSWLITAIAEVFGKYYKNKSVMEMLTLANAKVKELCSKKHPDERRAMSIIESSLVKEFRLYDKKHEQLNKQSLPVDAQPRDSDPSQGFGSGAKEPQLPAKKPKLEQKPGEI